jgi:putative membrane protein insertion efficiency factor
MTSSTTGAQRTPPRSEFARAHERPALAFRLYKSLVSPILHAISPSRCLYLPTCSEYAYTAVHRFGPIRGSWLALRRFARCHPWGKGGLDFVPDPVPASLPQRAATTPTSASAPSPTSTAPADHLP